MPTSSNILLFSPHGMLGRAWRALLQKTVSQKTVSDTVSERENGIRHRFVGRPELDLTDPASIRKHVTADIDIVINCSAYTNVDAAEEHEDEATAVNGTGVGDLAGACKDANAQLVHYSTDYVFNGNATSPYPVDAPIEPVNAYGRSKAVGEALIRESGCEHLIIRTSWLYAPWGKNFVNTIANAAQKRDTLKVVNDQRGRPTSCEHLAASTMKLIDAGARGDFHITDGGECTWYDFATAIAARANPDCKVNPCTSDDYPTPAKRPGYSVLDLSRAETILGPMPSWRNNLGVVLDGITGSAGSTG